MAGLDSAGFTPETFDNISSRIKGRLEVYNPGFDFSPESPDGQLIEIFTYELYQAWAQLNEVFVSNSPQDAYGAGLRNIGLLTGLPFDAAAHATATVEAQGTAGTVIPAGTTLADGDGNEFYTSFATTIPSNLTAVAVEAGPIAVPAGSVTTIVTPVSGLTSITQTQAGVDGKVPMTELEYKNHRQRTVMRNYTDVASTMTARLLELGLGQVNVYNNDDPSVTAPDGTPPNTIHVNVGEPGDITDDEIAQVILNTKPLGCPTYGSDFANVPDSQGVVHKVNFSVATQREIEILVNVTYLSVHTAGAEENIKNALLDHINNLNTGEDVVWSRLFGLITPYAKAQVNVLTIGYRGGSQGTANLTISDSEYANMLEADLDFTEV